MLRFTPTSDGITLTAGHTWERLHAHLADLIKIHLEMPSAQRRGLQYLRELKYVSGENKDERSSMHFELQAREVGDNAKDATLTLTFIVSTK